MTEEAIRSRYATIVNGLDAVVVGRVWTAVLTGRQLDEPDLRERAVQLDELRDNVGRASAARKSAKPSSVPA